MNLLWTVQTVGTADTKPIATVPTMETRIIIISDNILRPPGGAPSMYVK